MDPGEFEERPKRHLRSVNGLCEHWSGCEAQARWLVRRGTKRGEAMLTCGRHLLPACNQISEGLRPLIVTPVIQ